MSAPRALRGLTVPDETAAALAAVWAVYRRDGRATVKSVAAELGHSTTTTHKHLGNLARLGLVDGVADGGGGGRLRPLVWPGNLP